MLDAESCGRREQCTGLQAVEIPADGSAPHLATSHVQEFTNPGDGGTDVLLGYDTLPMVTIRASSGAPNGFTLNPGARIVDPNLGLEEFSLAGLVTGGTGAITVFNAGEYPPC